MKDYRKLYDAELGKLSDAYGTQGYTAVKEDYFKLFEEFAAADVRLMADFIDDPENFNTPEEAEFLAEILADMDRQIGVLYRVNQPLAAIWVRYYSELKTRYLEITTC